MEESIECLLNALNVNVNDVISDQLSQNESQLSSDLSIEFSLPEEELILPFDEEEEEEEELPCFPMHFSKRKASLDLSGGQ